MMKGLLIFLLVCVAWWPSFSQGEQRLPPNSKIIYFGDSQTSFGYNSNPLAPSVQFQNYGFIAWTNALAPDAYMDKDGMQGVPGETTAQMVQRLNALQGTGARILVVLAGTNDPLYAIGPEQTKANLRRIFNAGLAAGMKVIAVTIQPRFAPNAYNAADEAGRKAINEWIKSQADVIPLDVENDLNDPQYFDDGLHNSTIGAYVLGNRVAAAINELVDHCEPGSLTAQDLAVASNSNPLMSGTAGRLSIASGTVATNWQLAGNFAGGATVTGAKELENGREKQVINIFGTYTGPRRVTFNNYAGGHILLSAGDVVEGVAEIEIASPMRAIKSIYLTVQAYTPDYATTLVQGNSMWPTSSKANYMPPGKYLLRTPPMTIANGTVGQLTTQIVIEFVNTTTVDPIAATIKVSSIGFRQLPLFNGPAATISPAGPLSLCPDSTVTLDAAGGSGYVFQWQLDGRDLPGATSSAYHAGQTGTYNVKVSAPGCTVLSAPKVIAPAADCPVDNSIKTGTLPAAICGGQLLTIPFTATGRYTEGNEFTVQLSDENGSFANPLILGSLAGTAGTAIDVLLPPNLPMGTGYRIRVGSSAPALAGTDNGQDIAVHAAVKASINAADTVSSYPALPRTLTASPQGNGYVYQWLYNGQPAGENSASHLPQATGAYRVLVTGPGGCSDTSKPVYVKLLACREMTVTATQSGGDAATATVQGGYPPYRYTLDSLTYQDGNRFSGLEAGRRYTVYVKDSVNCTAQYSFSLNAIVTGAAPLSLCSGQSFTIPFTTYGYFQPGNQFYLELSDGQGAFGEPTTLRILEDTAGSSVVVTLPPDLPTGTAYRIRVRSSNPVMIGSDNGGNITIHAPVHASLLPAADTVESYPGLSLTLTVSEQQQDYTYQWLQDGVTLGAGGPVYSPSETGSYRVIVSNGGCADTSGAVYVKMRSCRQPAISVSQTGSTSVAISVEGGFPPFSYSLDNAIYQTANAFANLETGRTYTVYVKDSVNCVTSHSFALALLQTGPVISAVCTGRQVVVPFTKSGLYQDGNLFTLQLSNGHGSFESPLVLGTISDTAGGFFAVVVPDTLQPGNGYRFRVVSSHPEVTGSDNGQDIVLHAPVTATINLPDTVQFFPNLAATLQAFPQGEGYAYQWLQQDQPVGGAGSRYQPVATAWYRVVVNSAGGCADTSNAVFVLLAPCGPIAAAVSQAGTGAMAVTAAGGYPPYLFSLDGENYQQENVFHGLEAGYRYTVFVKDSVHCTAEQNFVLNELRTGTLPASLCSGRSLTVPFTATGLYQPGNVFSVQLSDGSGSFAKPVVLGAVQDTVSGNITVSLPADVLPDTAYRIRVVSSSPVTQGTDNGQSLSIGAMFNASLSPADTASSYPGQPLSLTALPQQQGYRYQWLRDNTAVDETGPVITPDTAGLYRVVVSNGSCADTSKPTYVRIQNCAPLDISISSRDAAVFTVNVSGGHAPYRFSLDSINYQISSSFSNLAAGHDYTVYVKDSVNCRGQLRFTIRDAQDCDIQQGIGGRSTIFATQNLGTQPGIVVVPYEVLPSPDQIDIYYNDSTVVTTRQVEDTLGWLWFSYQPPTGGPARCNIRMQTTSDEPVWKYTALCPISSYTAMKNGADTTSTAVFVSPNFPYAYPANTELVHTFTPGSAGAKLHVDFKALMLVGSGELWVYDGADTTAPLLGRFSGGFSYANNPLLVAANPGGQLTFKFVTGEVEGKYGWVANIYYRTSIDAFYPQAARTGDTVTISGAGFSGATAVRFGGVPAQSYEVVSDTLIRAVVSVGQSGDVEVQVPGGTAAHAGFSYIPEIVLCPNGSGALPAGVQGAAYQWQVSTDSLNFSNIADNEEYSGTNTATLQLTSLSSSHYGHQYRCVVDGANGITYTIRFVSTWLGGSSTAWEDAANWKCGVLPDANTDVIIGSGGTVILGTATSIRSLTTQPGSHLTLSPAAVLTLTR